MIFWRDRSLRLEEDLDTGVVSMDFSFEKLRTGGWPSDLNEASKDEVRQPPTFESAGSESSNESYCVYCILLSLPYFFLLPFADMRGGFHAPSPFRYESNLRGIPWLKPGGTPRRLSTSLREIVLELRSL